MAEKPKLDCFGTVRIFRMGEQRGFRLKLNESRCRNVNKHGPDWQYDAHWILARIRAQVRSHGVRTLGFVDLDRDQIKIVDISDDQTERMRREIKS